MKKKGWILISTGSSVSATLLELTTIMIACTDEYTTLYSLTLPPSPSISPLILLYYVRKISLFLSILMIPAVLIRPRGKVYPGGFILSIYAHLLYHTHYRPGPSIVILTGSPVNEKKTT